VTAHFFGKKRWRLVENGREVFNVESRPELLPIHLRLVQALLQEKLLIEQLREAVDRPDKARSKIKNPLTELILETAVTIKGRGTISLPVLVHRAVSRRTKVSIRHVRGVLKKVATDYPNSSIEDAICMALAAEKARS
jgi:hypothetical protein